MLRWSYLHWRSLLLSVIDQSRNAKSSWTLARENLRRYKGREAEGMCANGREPFSLAANAEQCGIAKFEIGTLKNKQLSVCFPEIARANPQNIFEGESRSQLPLA